MGTGGLRFFMDSGLSFSPFSILDMSRMVGI